MPIDTGDERLHLSMDQGELDRFLIEWNKAATDDNRRTLAAAAARFLEDTAWAPHTRERFSRYAEARDVKRLLSDHVSSAADDHPYTVIRDWQSAPTAEQREDTKESPPVSPETVLKDESPLTPPREMAKPAPAPHTIIQESSVPPVTQAIVAPGTEAENPAPLGRPPKKRRTPLFFIIWGLVIVAAIVIVLLIVQPGADASGVKAPAYMDRPEEAAAPSLAGDTEETSLSPVDRFTHTVRENSPVYFIADREIWMPGEEAKLDRILSALSGLRAAALTVTGHTADDGQPNAQFVLSAERAIAVRDYFLKHQPETELDITIIGRGANDPVVTGVPPAQQGPNRRAEIRVDQAE